jgi:hypothetical protein
VAREIEEDNDAEVEALLNSERERMNREKEEVAHLEMVLDALYMTEDTMSLLRATLLPGTMSALGEARHFIRLWREQLLYQIDDDNYDHWLYRTHKEMQERGEDLDFPRVPQSMDSLRRRLLVLRHETAHLVATAFRHVSNAIDSLIFKGLGICEPLAKPNVQELCKVLALSSVEAMSLVYRSNVYALRYYEKEPSMCTFHDLPLATYIVRNAQMPLSEQLRTSVTLYLNVLTAALKDGYFEDELSRDTNQREDYNIGMYAKVARYSPGSGRTW